MVSMQVRRPLAELAAAQDGVFSRAQGRVLGIDRWVVAHEVSAGRWQQVGPEAVAVHTLELQGRALWWAALFNGGASCVLDGVTALQAAGLRRFEEPVVHLITPWPNGPRSWEGVHVHRSRLWDQADFVDLDGLRRTRPAVATVRAAMWARSDRAAVTVMAMAVQQRLCNGTDVLHEALKVNRHKRRRMFVAAAHDIAHGAQALSELDFSALCRRAGLPTPARQVLRQGARGRWYLDASWEDFGISVEIEGAHHDAPEGVLDDTLRQNELTIRLDRVLRIPVLGLRACPEAYLDQLRRALTGAGWVPSR